MEENKVSFKRGSIHRVTIEDIVFGGKGIAKVDDFVFFVENTIPGDVVDVKITKKKKSFAESYVVHYHSRGDGYISPQCSHFDYCGGCKWQNLTYEKQLAYKKKQVIDSIERIGHITNPPVQDTIPSPDIFAYRNKMEYSFSDNRWLTKEELGNPDIEKGFACGLHVPGAYNKIIDINTCHISDDMFNIILNEFKQFAKESGNPVYNIKSHEGVWRFLMIRRGVHKNEYMVNIVTSRSIKEDIEAFCKDFVKRYPQVTSIVNNLNRRKAQIAEGEEEIVIVGNSKIHESLGHFTFEISANSFFQTNTKQAEVMYDLVKKLSDFSGNETVFDMYSGTGTIPIYLADSVKQVYGFELVESSVNNARENIKKLGIKNVEFVCGYIKETMPKYKHLNPDILVIDPPRAGMHQDVVDLVLFMEAKSFVYVSCNPTTLARDLEWLSEKYEIETVYPLDMFPHTYHIETIVKLILK